MDARDDGSEGLRPETAAFGELFAAAGLALDGMLGDAPPDPVRVMDRWRSLAGPLPVDGAGSVETIERLLRDVLPYGTRLTHPRSWAFITTGPSTVPSVAAAVANVASPQRYTVTAFNLLEELSLDWLAELCGLGDHMKGVYSSGGSTANLVALGAARQWALDQRGIDPAATGLTGQRLAVYTSVRAHHTVQRSAGVLGIGRRNVRLIAVDDQERMDLDALRAAMQTDADDGVVPVAVVAAAGTTDTGAIDPLRGAGEIAREFGAWYHVDGAYGLPGILDDRVAPLFDGLELADSVIVDPHKWLNAPVGVAATFVRDRAILHDAFTQEPAEYLEGSFSPADVAVSLDSMGIPYQDFGVELSSPARGVQVWAILTELGRDGVRRRVTQDLDYARYVADRAREHPRLELMLEPTLSICCFRYRTPDGDGLDELNQHLLRRLLRETDLVLSATVVRGAFVLRPCFINPRTDPTDVEALVEAVITIGDDLARGRTGASRSTA